MNKQYDDDRGGVDSNTVGVYRTAATVKGGRRFSFSSMVVCGDRQGRVGLGYGKANQVPNAIEKATKKAKREMREFPLTGTTIPHQVTGKFGACTVRLVPASPGTGVIAGAAVRKHMAQPIIKTLLRQSWTVFANCEVAKLLRVYVKFKLIKHTLKNRTKRHQV
jgi:small subunit ribosomal protein S5